MKISKIPSSAGAAWKISLPALVATGWLVACTSTPVEPPAAPMTSWDAACQHQDMEGTKNWVVLACTLTNRSAREVDLAFIPIVQSPNNAWRQPELEEIEQLKKEVVSGLWIVDGGVEPMELPETTQETVRVKPGQSVRQRFILFKEAPTPPETVSLLAPAIGFEKVVLVRSHKR